MKVYFNGKQYRTLSACYADNEDQARVGLATVRRRLRHGWSIDMALLTPPQPTFVSRHGSHTIKGQDFANLPAVAACYSMSDNAIFKRFGRGFRGDRLVPLYKLQLPPATGDAEPGKFVAGDKSYRSAADACRELGVKYVTYQHRAKRGLSREQSLGLVPAPDGRKTRGCAGKGNPAQLAADRFSTPRMVTANTAHCAPNPEFIDLIPGSDDMATPAPKSRRRTSLRLAVGNVFYTSYAALARAHEMPPYLVRQRIVCSNYTPEQAVSGHDFRQIPITVAGIRYKSLAAAAAAHRLSLEVLLARLRTMSADEALGLVPRQTSRTVEYAGKYYPSRLAAARAQSVTPGALNGRLRKGLSFEEALDLGPQVRNPGRYNLSILQRDPALASTPASTYLAEITIDGRNHHKIGVTRVSVESRLRQESLPFRVLAVFHDTLLNCFQLEQMLHKRFAEKRSLSITAASLEGYTEIFDLTGSDVNAVHQAMSEPSPHRM